MPIAGNSFANKYFLDSAVCVSDVLGELGYTQRYLSGLDSSFSGMRYFLGSHAISALDLPALQAQGSVPNPLPKELQGFWGLKDSALLTLAKDVLESLPEPFALYVSTIDTHAPNGFVDTKSCPRLGDSYQEAFTCADKLLADFIAQAQARFGENLTIILLGDHLSHKGDGFFTAFGKRSIYNLFINPKFTTPYNQAQLKNRQMSHFDIAPLILDSIGVETRAFALGRNPLYGATLLESTYTKSALDSAISARNQLYNSFWEVNHEKIRR